MEIKTNTFDISKRFSDEFNKVEETQGQRS